MSRLSERIENYNKAFELYDEICEQYKQNSSNNANRLGLVQSFEIVSELGWKVLKDYLSTQEINVYTPKEVIKEAFQYNVIKNGQIWIDMIRDRNATSHEYNNEKVDIILERISTSYHEELKLFKNWLRDI